MTDKKGSTGEKLLYCSFCGKSQHKVKKLITGSSVFTCDECIDLCNGIIRDEAAIPGKEGGLAVKSDLSTPHETRQNLDQYVTGQEQARKILVIAACNHYKRLKHLGKKGDVELSKSNILLIGPTDSDKTLLAQTLVCLLNIPFVIADAATLTGTGYVGEDVESIIQKLLQNCNYEVDKAQHSIIHIDGIDKIPRKSDNSSITRDVSGGGVRQALLKLIEGMMASVPPQDGRRYPNQDLPRVNMTNILSICGGAFNGLEKIVVQRFDKAGISFGTEVQSKEERDVSEALPQVGPEDPIKLSLISKLIGRLPVVVTLIELDEAVLIEILVEPRNAIVKQYQKLLAMGGAELEIRPSALTAIARKAIRRKTGARGLRSIVEHALADVMYDLLNYGGVQKVVIDESTISDEGKLLPICEE